MVKNLGMIFGSFLVLMVLYFLAKAMFGFDRSQSNPKVEKVETEFGTHEFLTDSAQGNKDQIPMH